MTAQSTLKLIVIPQAGALKLQSPDAKYIQEVVDATRSMYAQRGFEQPWVCYLAVEGNDCVGTCGFKGPARDGHAEIAYFTFPGRESRGVATRMVTELVRIAREADANVMLTAQTLPEENASTAILRKFGFTLVGEVQSPEDGRVWQWHVGQTPQVGG